MACSRLVWGVSTSDRGPFEPSGVAAPLAHLAVRYSGSSRSSKAHVRSDLWICPRAFHHFSRWTSEGGSERAVRGGCAEYTSNGRGAHESESRTSDYWLGAPGRLCRSSRRIVWPCHSGASACTPPPSAPRGSRSCARRASAGRAPETGQAGESTDGHTSAARREGTQRPGKSRCG